jgi:hypothetical protein
MATKRIDVPCPWCGARCCKIDGEFREWTCGSKEDGAKFGLCGPRWQSPGCRVREIDQTPPAAVQPTRAALYIHAIKTIAELRAIIKEREAEIKDIREVIEKG